jgi:hypothetical protein
VATTLAEPNSPSHEATCDCLPEYNLLDCLGRTPLAEVWKAQGPDGRLWAVKYIYAVARHGILSTQHFKAAQRLQDMRHPGLASVVAVANDEGRLVLVTDLADLTLRDRFEECWAEGHSGIPRTELLTHLHAAAAALDYLRAEHALQHLSLNPRNLVIADHRLLVSDYGLVQLLWLPAGQAVAKINPRYAPPEMFEGRLSANSDQYSLALIYQEMLTGHLPLRGHSSRQLAEARMNGQPNLDVLPGQDREVVARALQVDPRERFACCSDFVKALLAARGEGSPLLVQPATGILFQDGKPAEAVSHGVSPEQVVHQLVRAAADSVTVKEFGQIRYNWTPDGVWQHKCAAFLSEGMGRQKLKSFLTRWNADVVHFDDESLVFRLDLGTSLWQKLMERKQHTLEVAISMSRARPAPVRLTEVTVRMHFLKGDSASRRKLLDQVGPVIVDELHAYLMATRERRIQERFAFAHPLCVAPATRAAGSAQRLECVGKDISYTGIGFYTPFEPPAKEVFIYQASSSDQAPFAIPAAVARVQKTAEGWYEAGARFLVNPPPSTSTQP